VTISGKSDQDTQRNETYCYSRTHRAPQWWHRPVDGNDGRRGYSPSTQGFQL